MKQSIQSAAQEQAPWNEDVPWWLIVVEGVIAAILGIYMITATDVATTTVVYILSALLLIFSVLQLISGWGRIFDDPAGSTRSAADAMSLIRGGVGVSLAIVALLAEHHEYVNSSQARLILGAGLLAFGILGLLGTVLSGLFGGNNWSALLSDTLFTLIGAVIFYSNWKRDEYSESQIIEYIGYAALIAGVLLALYAFFIKRGEDERKAVTLKSISS